MKIYKICPKEMMNVFFSSLFQVPYIKMNNMAIPIGTRYFSEGGSPASQVSNVSPAPSGLPDEGSGNEEKIHDI